MVQPVIKTIIKL